MKQQELFRLAAVLYADNNYDVEPKTILKKVIESAFVINDNAPLSIHELIDLILTSYNLHLDEKEVADIVKKENEAFLTHQKNGECLVCLSEKRKQNIALKLSNKTIDYFIEEFEKENSILVTGSNVKEIIYRFLYELLSTNIESFKKLLDNKKKVEELINVESHSYTPIEKEIINEFLGWENDSKNKAIFDIASYALEYCMISNNGNGTHIHLNNLKNKTFYLDTNIIFRALGINGVNRQNRTVTFLTKFTEAKTSLFISKFTEQEFKSTISFYIDKLRKHPLNRQINPEIFKGKYYDRLNDIYDFYYKWRAGKSNESLDLFEAHIHASFESFKRQYKVEADYKIPFNEKDEKTESLINELASSINTHKSYDRPRYSSNADKIDALNIHLIELKREGKDSNIFETKQFIVSTDQSLRRWDYGRSQSTPVIILPSQWLSILLRYIDRTTDDFKSFVSFLNLPNGESQIDSEKLHIVLSGISEMTEDFSQQQFIVESLVHKKFQGVIENGFDDEEIQTKTKEYSKTILDRKIEDITTKYDGLEEKFNTHKSSTEEEINQLKGNINNETKQRISSEDENTTLKEELRKIHVNKKMRPWKFWGYLSLFGILIILIFFTLQICLTEWKYNYVQQLINFIDTNKSETKQDWMRTLVNGGAIGALGFMIKVAFTRLRLSDKYRAKQDSIMQNLPNKLK